MLKPFSEEPWMHLEMTYRRKGDQASSDEAAHRTLELAEAKLTLNPEDVITLSRMPAYYVRFGDKDKALQAMTRVLKLDPTDGLALYNCACTYAVIGDRALAIDCLKKAFTNGYGHVREWVRSDPDFMAFREDPEFRAFVM